jgi:hypothetical protein
MKISFDLDDTLIPGQKVFPTEPQNLFQKLLGIEPIRKGAVQLIKQLRDEGHTICIYTTSFRKPLSIRTAFLTYGISVDQIINQSKHDAVLKDKKNVYSKYPPAFDIDIHIDDSAGVAMEGEQFNFKTIIIGENNPHWVSDILSYFESKDVNKSLG